MGGTQYCHIKREVAMSVHEDRSINDDFAEMESRPGGGGGGVIVIGEIVLATAVVLFALWWKYG